MQVTTVFNINDIVWVIDGNKVAQRRITFIDWDTVNGVRYHVYIGDGRNTKEYFKEKECFPTKEALIKSL